MEWTQRCTLRIQFLWLLLLTYILSSRRKQVPQARCQGSRQGTPEITDSPTQCHDPHSQRRRRPRR